jgi:hypothetical protein
VITLICPPFTVDSEARRLDIESVPVPVPAVLVMVTTPVEPVALAWIISSTVDDPVAPAV